MTSEFNVNDAVYVHGQKGIVISIFSDDGTYYYTICFEKGNVNSYIEHIVVKRHLHCRLCNRRICSNPMDDVCQYCSDEILKKSFVCGYSFETLNGINKNKIFKSDKNDIVVAFNDFIYSLYNKYIPIQLLNIHTVNLQKNLRTLPIPNIILEFHYNDNIQIKISEIKSK